MKRGRGAGEGIGLKGKEGGRTREKGGSKGLESTLE